jgi:hypothetical protein
MLHYHVWFDLKPEIAEADGLRVIHDFLSKLMAERKIAAFRLLKNTATKPDTVLASYDAQIEFNDDAQFAAAFDDLRSLGIHAGPHGEIIQIVADFSADVFQEL